MPTVTYSRFAVEANKLYEPPLRARATRKQVRQVLREFTPEDPETPVEDALTAVAVADWIAAYPDRSGIRKRSLLRTLQATIGYAKSREYLHVGPFDWRGVNDWVRADVLSPKQAAGRKKLALRPAEMRKLFRTVDEEAEGPDWKARRMRGIVYLFAFTGMRFAEGMRLRRRDVNLRRRYLKIEPRVDWRAKSERSAAKLPIGEELADVLAWWMPHSKCEWLFPGVERVGPWVHGCNGYRPIDFLKALGRRAGIRNLTYLGFRKTVGTLAKRWGMGQLELQSLLRHGSVETQKFYDEDRLDELRHTIAKIRYDLAA